MTTPLRPDDPRPSLRLTSLIAAVLTWYGAGIQLGLGALVDSSAAADLFGVDPRDPTHKTLIGSWFAWWLASLFLGGAFGGWLFGVVGDRWGRVRALVGSILCYAGATGLSALATSAEQMLVLRFLAGLGIGGAWPAAVSLMSEAWPSASRPKAAGVLGAAANVGVLCTALVGMAIDVNPADWRTITWFGAAPLLFAIWIVKYVPESEAWRRAAASPARARGTTRIVFGPEYLGRTILGILLAGVPLVGTWASGKWFLPWAESLGVSKSTSQAVWAVGAVVGSSNGAWLANLCGRRATYFTLSALALAINVCVYSLLTPESPAFLPMIFVLGVTATLFFGWLPLYLPELFPTEIRATGTGVTYNFGRFATAFGVIAAGYLLDYFGGDYARTGLVTAMVYGLGMIVILFAPTTQHSELRQDQT